MRNKILSFREE